MKTTDENRLKKVVKELGIVRVSRVTHVSQNTILRAIAGLRLHGSTETLLTNSLSELEQRAESEKPSPSQAA